MSGNAESSWPGDQLAYVSDAEPWRTLTTTGSSDPKGESGNALMSYISAVMEPGDVTDG